MSARRPLVAGNWKMFHGGPTAFELGAAIAREAKAYAHVDVVVCPPYTALAAVAHELDGSRVELGAQNLHPLPEGAFTGEISAQMLLDSGCRWAIVGHSERRQYFGDTDALVREKVAAALGAGLRPIACLGETLEQREAGRTLDVVRRQLAAFAPELGRAPGTGVIAYEPVWAIGTGRVAGPDQAQEVHAMIRAELLQLSADLAEKTRILYGGSVKADNAAALFACPDVDGALVGGASLEVASFMKIVAAPTRA